MGGTDKKQAVCKPLGNIISDVLQQCQGGDGFNARAVWAFWDRIVGESVARNAQPAAFKQRTLLVHVSSSVWLQELHFRKNELIDHLNREAGTIVVDDIRFKIGALKSKK
jgi:predicted nucleic acid-binding Zn ribbon protein